MFDTTITMRRELKEKIKVKANEAGTTFNRLVKKCVMRCVRQVKKRYFAKKLTMYHPDHPFWDKPHYYVSEEEFDAFLDIKKTIRISFSYFVTIAVELFIDEVINEEEQDSYRIPRYTKKFLMIENSPMFIFY
jgi:hypothetical protein